MTVNILEIYKTNNITKAKNVLVSDIYRNKPCKNTIIQCLLNYNPRYAEIFIESIGRVEMEELIKNKEFAIDLGKFHIRLYKANITMT